MKNRKINLPMIFANMRLLSARCEDGMLRSELAKKGLCVGL